jgi:small subunit ribosomal protein S11
MQCLTIAVNGFGHGRNALFAALTSREGALVAERVRYLQDATPIKIGGSKPSKRRVL